tara:strand:- start:3171 stop:4364 length:1194 start_codon:yes stop_codon:yes gene_type:complete
MKKKLLIILWPFKFRKFDYERYEFKELEKRYNYQILVHELINVLYPHFKKAYHENFNYKDKKTFNSIEEWKRDLRVILKDTNSQKLIIKHGIDGKNRNEYLINYHLKKIDINVLEIKGKGFPARIISKSLTNIIESIIRKIKNPHEFIFFIRTKFYTFLTNTFCKRKKYILAGGLKEFKKNKKVKLNSVIEANSFDYSKYLSNRLKFKKENKYILFIEAPVPIFKGDELIYKGKSFEGTTKKNWIPSLNNFFDKIEKIYKLKVKIAGHPKVKHKKNPKYYGGREVLNKPLLITSSKAKFVISVWSTGHSFAMIFNKPSLLISSNEMAGNLSFLQNQYQYSDLIGSNILNIDEEFEEKKIKSLIKINKKRVKEYKNNFLTSRKDKKPNYKLINEVVIR